MKRTFFIKGEFMRKLTSDCNYLKKDRFPPPVYFRDNHQSYFSDLVTLNPSLKFNYKENHNQQIDHTAKRES
jgi:hypothetical protein